jgi:hypothetical protein
MPVIAVVLEPNEATRAANGKALFGAMMKALGSEDPLKLRDITVSGSATSYSDGKQTDWDFDAQLGPPSLMEARLSASSGALVFQCSGEKCSERKKRGGLLTKGLKALPDAISENLQTNLRAFARYNLGTLLEEVKASRSLSAPSAYGPGIGEQHLRGEVRDLIYDVTLDADLLPSAVTIDNKAGLGSGIKLAFGGYMKIGALQYPKRTTIRLPDSSQHGIEIRLDKATPGGNLKPADFAK